MERTRSRLGRCSHNVGRPKPVTKIYANDEGIDKGSVIAERMNWAASLDLVKDIFAIAFICGLDDLASQLSSAMLGKLGGLSLIRVASPHVL